MTILAVALTTGNLSTNPSHAARLATHPKCVWFSTPTAQGQNKLIVVIYVTSAFLLMYILQLLTFIKTLNK
jgi:hypothetical protein